MQNFFHRTKLNYRLLPIHAGILVTFAIVPVWYRFKPAPGSFDALYSTGFLIFWPMLWTVVWWLLMGLPGFRALRQDRIRCLWSLTLLLLAVWAFMSWSWAYTHIFRPEVTIGAALPFALAALFAVVVACAAPPIRQIILVLVISMVVSSLIAGWQVARQGPVRLEFLGEFNINPAKSGISVVEADGIRWLRPYGLLPHPNILAGSLTVGLLAVVTWVLSNRSRWRWLGAMVFLMGLWALLLTFSRSAWIAFAAGGFALLPFVWERIRRHDLRLSLGVFILAVIAAGALFFALYRPFLAARVEGDEGVELRSVSDRVIYNDMAYRAIGESPILGLGIGNFPWRASYYLSLTDFDLRGQPVHQIFLSVWSELGLVGYLLMTLTLILGVEGALRNLRLRRDPLTPEQETERIAHATLLVGVITLMLIGLLDHYPWTLLHFQLLWWGLLALAGKPLQTSAAALADNGASSALSSGLALTEG
jgi:O-antigen ligase